MTVRIRPEKRNPVTPVHSESRRPWNWRKAYVRRTNTLDHLNCCVAKLLLFVWLQFRGFGIRTNEIAQSFSAARQANVLRTETMLVQLSLFFLRDVLYGILYSVVRIILRCK